jgi:hypothetical protein
MNLVPKRPQLHVLAIKHTLEYQSLEIDALHSLFSLIFLCLFLFLCKSCFSYIIISQFSGYLLFLDLCFFFDYFN